MKRCPDLSVRPPTNGGRNPNLNFRDQKRYVNTVNPSAASIVDIFDPRAALTVQWMTVQISTAIILQAYLSGQPFGAALTLGAGAVLHFPGTLLAPNEKLQFSVSGATSISFEVVYVNAIRPDLIDTDLTVIASGATAITMANISQWGGVAVAAALADAPVGTEVAPVTRPIFRKKTTIETTTPLLAGATFTGPWHDSELDGTACVMVYSLSNVAAGAAAASFAIQVTEDTTNAGLIQSAASSASNPAVSAGVVGRAFAMIKARYWRVVYTNGGTNQTTFELTSCAFNAPWQATNVFSFAGNNGNVAEQVQTVFSIQQGTRIAAFGDANGNSSMNFIGPDTGLVNAPPVFPLLFNGATWDRPRNNANVTTGDTGAKVATFNGATQTNFDATSAFITALLGVVSGTTPTMTLQLQWSPDGGTTWLNLGPATATLTATNQTGLIAIGPTNWSQTPGATPANITNGATVSVFLNALLPRTWRIVYTIAGTTPSFTISSVQVNYIRG